MVDTRSRLAAGAATAVVALASSGCLTPPPDPAPTVANSTDEIVYLTFWRGARSDPGFAFVRPGRELRVDFLAQDDDTGCLTEGGWHTMEIHDSDPEPDIDGDVERQDLLADPVHTHDIDRQPLCGGETWTWDGEQLRRTD